jgi:hypothetical protein
MDKNDLIKFPIGGQDVDADGKKIEPDVIAVGPANDGGNPSIADVAAFGSGPDVRNKPGAQSGDDCAGIGPGGCKK